MHSRRAASDAVAAELDTLKERTPERRNARRLRREYADGGISVVAVCERAQVEPRPIGIISRRSQSSIKEV